MTVRKPNLEGGIRKHFDDHTLKLNYVILWQKNLSFPTSETAPVPYTSEMESGFGESPCPSLAASSRSTTRLSVTKRGGGEDFSASDGRFVSAFRLTAAPGRPRRNPGPETGVRYPLRRSEQQQRRSETGELRTAL